MSAIVWKGSTTLIILGDEQLLTDAISGGREASASVQATVYNETQSKTLGPFAMPAVSGTPGRYRGVIPYNQADLEIGDRLRIEIFADAGSSKRLTVAMKATVKMRTA